eukprot:4248821-Amphidinium_carterae.1
MDWCCAKLWNETLEQYVWSSPNMLMGSKQQDYESGGEEVGPPPSPKTPPKGGCQCMAKES